MGLMERVKQRAPAGMLNTETLLRDQFVEQVLDSSLCHELKQMVCAQLESPRCPGDERNSEVLSRTVWATWCSLVLCGRCF